MRADGWDFSASQLWPYRPNFSITVRSSVMWNTRSHHAVAWYLMSGKSICRLRRSLHLDATREVVRQIVAQMALPSDVTIATDADSRCLHLLLPQVALAAPDPTSFTVRPQSELCFPQPFPGNRKFLARDFEHRIGQSRQLQSSPQCKEAESLAVLFHESEKGFAQIGRQ